MKEWLFLFSDCCSVSGRGAFGHYVADCCSQWKNDCFSFQTVVVCQEGGPLAIEWLTVVVNERMTVFVFQTVAAGRVVSWNFFHYVADNCSPWKADCLCLQTVADGEAGGGSWNFCQYVTHCCSQWKADCFCFQTAAGGWEPGGPGPEVREPVTESHGGPWEALWQTSAG